MSGIVANWLYHIYHHNRAASTWLKSHEWIHVSINDTGLLVLRTLAADTIPIVPMLDELANFASHGGIFTFLCVKIEQRTCYKTKLCGEDTAKTGARRSIATADSQSSTGMFAAGGSSGR